MNNDFDDFNDSGEFKSLPPEKLRDLFDDDAKDLFPQSFSVREMEELELAGGSGSSKKPDFSMGAYFKGRSSYPGVNDNSAMLNSHLFDLPEQDTSTDSVSRRNLRSLMRESTSTEKENRKCSSSNSFHVNSRNSSVSLTPGDANNSASSIKSLVDFFNDPDKSPMSSSAIMDHVLNYCKIRHEKGSEVVQDTKRKQRHSESFINLGRKLSVDSQKRHTESYNTFSSALSKKQHTSRCSTPDKVFVTSPNQSFLVSEKYEERDTRLKELNVEQSTASSSYISRGPETRRQPLPLQENNIRPQQPPGIQLQLNIPQTGLPQNLPGPLVINIVCPPGDSLGSTVTSLNSRSNGHQDIAVHGNSQQTQTRSSDNTSRPQIAIQFSGTIQWNQ
ncbi:unnamed protein product [Allacma fusca]|uniref:Uncharacterized protein n=1 Tax=Allacma fusca TaxID=39272 RepID=A0A8J2JD31_9HEXA|nr:unnamed protein product [Allacma fusca]